MQKPNLTQNVYKILKFKKPFTSQQRKNYLTAVHFPAYVKYNVNVVGNATKFEFVRFNQTNSLKCWKCGANRLITDLLCAKCNVIQQPHNSENYFKVLDIQEDFDVDLKLLTTKYRKLQTVLHPDKFSNKSDEEKTISADYSALVNKAYSTLQAPLSRAIHMLFLRGEKLEDDQKVTDPEFLMEIMELNEEVEQADSPDQLRKLNDKNRDIMEGIEKEICDYFRQDHIEKAKNSVIKMKYYNSVRSHINGLLRERGIVD